MQSSLLPAYVSYAAIAVAIALIYLALVRSGRWLADLMYRRRRLLRLQPAEPVRRDLRRNGKRLSSHFNALLLAVVAFALLAVLGQRGWWPDWSIRVWVTLAVLMLIPQGYGLVKLCSMLARRWELLRLMELHDEVAEKLSEAQLRGNRVHFAVPSDAGYIDAAVVGANGVYALLIVPPPHGSESVTLTDGQLHFEPGGEAKPVKVFRDTIAALARNIQEGTGRRVVVQPVLVVPDCNVGTVDTDSILVVNMPACASFVGWRNPQAFLMDDEVRDIDAWLSGGRRPRDPAANGGVRVLDQTRRFASRVLPEFEN